jgi:hypothetical protein
MVPSGGYIQRAITAEQIANSTSDSGLKQQFMVVAHHWRELARQIDALGLTPQLEDVHRPADAPVVQPANWTPQRQEPARPTGRLAGAFCRDCDGTGWVLTAGPVRPGEVKAAPAIQCLACKGAGRLRRSPRSSEA